MDDHGRTYPLADVVVLCANPLTVRCPICKHVSQWVSEKVRT